MVDSDDWLDDDALAKVMDVLRAQAAAEKPVDLVMANYVYCLLYTSTERVITPMGCFIWNRKYFQYETII